MTSSCTPLDMFKFSRTSQACSCKYCCHRKARSITHSDCV